MGIRPDQFKDAIVKSVKNYNYNVQWDMTEASRKWTREGAKWLRKNPATEGATGKYNKGWRSKKTARGHVIYNKNRPEITHLLEKGHFTVNKKSWVGELPHIKPVEDQLVGNYESEVEDIIRKHSGGR